MYILKLNQSAKKDLKSIDRQNQVFILDSLEDFIRNFSSDYEKSLMHSGKIKKLQGQKELLYRLKLRSYRVIYKKYEDKLIILVVHITTREGAYK
ncbi:MAG: type II toxin-antitoxin system RelE/ParE family toxin [Sulfurimonas sp.]|uniref:type II toxin-antitoxin system RelE family toxin n=1 Tax=Sulfurimonas sp. TaxID=2022749 RepID=UPI002606E3C2|nr:type II toxin-antitoxin system RelE/ParE family toxin [Sulfurimonas sp.]MDD5401210.1 type II toxin-antitoxin system RelE/ParE family toxin [Sulfurimonas sp.]